jgi:acetylglutamate kinase
MIRVLKIGGNQLDDSAFVLRIARAVKQMHDLPIIVHGGSKSIKILRRKLGIQARHLDDLSVNKFLPLEITMMALCGQLNPNLVAALISVGVDAQGFNGSDRGLIRAKPVLRTDGSIGRVGDVTSVRTDILRETLLANIVPVVAPVILGEDGRFFSADADKIAGAIGVAINADQIVFLTNVPGVLHENTLVEWITISQGQELIDNGVVTGGMAVKLNAALESVLAGVKQVVITDIQGLEQGTGTIVTL